MAGNDEKLQEHICETLDKCILPKLNEDSLEWLESKIIDYAERDEDMNEQEPEALDVPTSKSSKKPETTAKPISTSKPGPSIPHRPIKPSKAYKKSSVKERGKLLDRGDTILGKSLEDDLDWVRNSGSHKERYRSDRMLVKDKLEAHPPGGKGKGKAREPRNYRHPYVEDEEAS